MRYAQLPGGRAQLRLPLSPVKAQMALQALENWRVPAEEGRELRWYKITNAKDGPVQVNIFDEISFYGVTAQDFVDDLGGIRGDVEVHINSPGGDAFDGITIFNALANRRGGVTTVVDGLAASAASIIAQAGQRRIMSPGSMTMIHDALALCIGNEADMLDMAKTLGKVSDNIASVYASRSSTPAAAWRKAMVAENWYTAEETVSAGLADSIAERPGDGDLAVAARFDRSLFARWTGQVLNEKYSAEDRRRMAENGQAMPDGSYPIADAEDLDNAIHAVGRGGASHDAIRRHIIKRAAALGLSSRIPENWNSDGSLGGGDSDDTTSNSLDQRWLIDALKGAMA